MLLKKLVLSSFLYSVALIAMAQEHAYVKGHVYKSSNTWWDSSTPKEIYAGVTLELYQVSNKIAETKSRDNDGQYFLTVSTEFLKNYSLLKLRVTPPNGDSFELSVPDHMVAKHEQWDQLTNKVIPYVKVRDIFIGPDEREARFRSQQDGARNVVPSNSSNPENGNLQSNGKDQ